MHIQAGVWQRSSIKFTRIDIDNLLRNRSSKNVVDLSNWKKYEQLILCHTWIPNKYSYILSEYENLLSNGEYVD